MTDLAPLQVGVVPEGRYARGSRSPIVWVWLCARCAGYAPTKDGSLRAHCQGCGCPVPEVHRFRAYIASTEGCGCELADRRCSGVTGDLDGRARPLLEQSSSAAAQGAAGAFAKHARDGRALAVAELLRSGWSAKEVSAGFKVIDAGGGVVLAMEAMRAARESRS